VCNECRKILVRYSLTASEGTTSDAYRTFEYVFQPSSTWRSLPFSPLTILTIRAKRLHECDGDLGIVSQNVFPPLAPDRTDFEQSSIKRAAPRPSIKPYYEPMPVWNMRVSEEEEEEVCVCGGRAWQMTCFRFRNTGSNPSASKDPFLLLWFYLPRWQGPNVTCAHSPE
jgi:hypothetical protein